LRVTGDSGINIGVSNFRRRMVRRKLLTLILNAAVLNIYISS